MEGGYREGTVGGGDELIKDPKVIWAWCVRRVKTPLAQR